jgi:hypothetical protein
VSDQRRVALADSPRPHPIRLVVTDDLQRNRLTVFLMHRERCAS